jgi:hypothetical protein
MMRHIPWFLLFAAVALVGLTCAPQAEVPPEKSGPAGDDTGSPIKEVPPVVVPKTLKDRIDTAIKHIAERELETAHSFWSVFHGILGNGLDTMMTDPETNKRHKALDIVRLEGHRIKGLEFIPMGDDGVEVHIARDTIGQGHQDQFVAEMVQWGLSPEAEFLVYELDPKTKQAVLDPKTKQPKSRSYRFADFLRYSKARASLTREQELSWAIVIIAEHYGTDLTWTNKDGEQITFEEIVRYELKQPIEVEQISVCGGTHRLFGLTWALHRHLGRGGKATGVWKEIQDKLDQYARKARKLQNPDGSFSTDYFRGRGKADNINQRIATTGHILEWLALALPEKELQAAWMQEAANRLCLMILENAKRGIDTGPLYHAAHGLHLYRARVFGMPKTNPPLIP